MRLLLFFIRIAANAVALWLAATFVTGIDFVAAGANSITRIGTEAGTDLVANNSYLRDRVSDPGFWVELLVVALVFTVVNMFVRPVVTFLSIPFVVLSLGLFLLVVNALMVLLTGAISERLSLGFSVDGFWPALWAGIVISVVNWVLGLVLPSGRSRR